jgi:hypothetical protein
MGKIKYSAIHHMQDIINDLINFKKFEEYLQNSPI